MICLEEKEFVKIENTLSDAEDGWRARIYLIYSQFFWLPIILKIILNSFGYLLFLKLFQNNISRPNWMLFFTSQPIGKSFIFFFIFNFHLFTVHLRILHMCVRLKKIID